MRERWRASPRLRACCCSCRTTGLPMARCGGRTRGMKRLGGPLSWRAWRPLLPWLCWRGVALAGYLRQHGAYRPGVQVIPWLAFTAMLLALIGNLYPVPEGPYGRLPYIYLAYLCAGLLWFLLQRRSKGAKPTQS